jgi:hypothetical protein
MATIYLDHSIITHPASWKPVEDVLTSGKAQLVLSLWNLFEIGSASDKAQQDQRLAFLMKFNPLWILERIQIQRHEVRAFLWKEKLRIEPEPVEAFRRHLSEVESYMVGSQTRIGVTPRQWIDGVDFRRFETPYLASCRKFGVCEGWVVELVGLKLGTHHPVIEPVSALRRERKFPPQRQTGKSRLIA